MQRLIKYFSLDSSIKELLVGSALTLLMKICGVIFGFLVVLLISRLLGVTEAGYYFTVLTVITIFSILVRLGLDQLITREVAAAISVGDWLRVNRLYSMSVFLVLAVSIAISFVLFSISDFIVAVVFNNLKIYPAWIVMVWSIIPFSLCMLHGFFFQGLKRFVPFMVSGGLGISVLMFFSLIFVLYSVPEATAQDIGFLYMLSFFVLLFLLVSIWWRQPEAKPMSPYSLGQFKRSASSLFLVQILNLIISWSSPFLLAIWANVDDVAIFSVAYRTAMSTSIILLAVNSITAPKFATLYRQGNLVELHRIVIWSTRLMLALCVPVVGFLFFFSDWIMSLFGDGFVSGGEVLIVLVIGQFVNVLTGSVVLLLTMTGNEKALIISTALSSLVMLLLSALLIPLYGALGAAVAQAVSVTCLMLLNTWFVKRALGFVPMNILAKLKGS